MFFYFLFFIKTTSLTISNMFFQLYKGEGGRGLYNEDELH